MNFFEYPSDIIYFICSFLDMRDVYDFLYVSKLFSNQFHVVIKKIFTLGKYQILPWHYRFKYAFPNLYDKHSNIIVNFEYDEILALFLGVVELKKNRPQERIVIISNNIEQWIDLFSNTNEEAKNIEIKIVDDLPTENYPKIKIPLIKPQWNRKPIRDELINSEEIDAWAEYNKTLNIKSYGCGRYLPLEKETMDNLSASLEEENEKLSDEDSISPRPLGILLPKITPTEANIYRDISDEDENIIRPFAYNAMGEQKDEKLLDYYPLLIISVENYTQYIKKENEKPKQHSAYINTYIDNTRHHLEIFDFQQNEQGNDHYSLFNVAKKSVGLTDSYLTSHYCVTKPDTRSKIKCQYEIHKYTIERAVELAYNKDNTLIVCGENTHFFCDLYINGVNKLHDKIVKTYQENNIKLPKKGSLVRSPDTPDSKIPKDKELIEKFLACNLVTSYSPNIMKECKKYTTFIFMDNTSQNIMLELTVSRNRRLHFYLLFESLSNLCIARLGPIPMEETRWQTLTLIEYMGFDLLKMWDIDLCFINGAMSFEEWEKIIKLESQLRETLCQQEIDYEAMCVPLGSTEKRLTIEEAKKLLISFEKNPLYKLKMKQTAFDTLNNYYNSLESRIC